jgi:polyisoprenyl-teichoic acid--peptidoglycan teichoic acid transferase
VDTGVGSDASAEPEPVFPTPEELAAAVDVGEGSEPVVAASEELAPGPVDDEAVDGLEALVAALQELGDPVPPEPRVEADAEVAASEPDPEPEPAAFEPDLESEPDLAAAFEPDPEAEPDLAASEPDPEAEPEPAFDRLLLDGPETVDGGRTRRWLVLGLVVAAMAVVVGGLVVAGVFGRALDLVTPTDDEAAVTPPSAVGGAQPTLLVVTHDEAAPDGRATGILVLAADRETGDGTVLLVPTATVADVPGSGSFQLAEAHAFDGPGLVAASLENLMEVRFDGVVSLSEAGWSALLTRIGGFEVDVRSRLIGPAADGGGEVRFEAGPQFLDGPRLAEYLTFRSEGDTELEALPRTQQVVTGMLDRIVAEPELLDEIFVDDAPMLSTTDPALVREVLALLAEARAADRLTTLTLPVATMGTGRDDLYRPDTERITALVDDRLAASRPTDAAGAGRSVQILNGNGIPGVGQQVAAALRDGGYRILLTGNADRFDYETTRIVVYDGSDASLAVARDVQARLGVGEVERSGTPQSVVDLTIVVGADFPPQE